MDRLREHINPRPRQNLPVIPGDFVNFDPLVEDRRPAIIGRDAVIRLIRGSEKGQLARKAVLPYSFAQQQS